MLASRGTHADSIREAGGIPLLVDVLRSENVSEETLEHTTGALAHLVMQSDRNRESLSTSGGVPHLARLLDTSSHSQAAEYSACCLGAIAMCGPPSARSAVRAHVCALPARVLDVYPSLREVACASNGAASAAGTTASETPTEAGGNGRGAGTGASTRSAPVLRRAVRFLIHGRWTGGEAVEERTRLADPSLPDDFICPVTHEAMADPVVASDGMTYERYAIREILTRGNGHSPLTRELLSATVYPNFQLRRRIQTWREEMNDARPVASSAQGIMFRQARWAHVEVTCAAAAAAAFAGVMTAAVISSGRELWSAYTYSC